MRAPVNICQPTPPVSQHDLLPGWRGGGSNQGTRRKAEVVQVVREEVWRQDGDLRETAWRNRDGALNGGNRRVRGAENERERLGRKHKDRREARGRQGFHSGKAQTGVCTVWERAGRAR